MKQVTDPRILAELNGSDMSMFIDPAIQKQRDVLAANVIQQEAMQDPSNQYLQKDAEFSKKRAGLKEVTDPEILALLNAETPAEPTQSTPNASLNKTNVNVSPTDKYGRVDGYSLENIAPNAEYLGKNVVAELANVGNNIIGASTAIPRLLERKLGGKQLNDYVAGLKNANQADLKALDDSPGSTIGRLGVDIAATAGMGDALAIGANAANMPRLAKALSSSGFNIGGDGAALFSKEGAKNLALRAAGGGGTGYAAGNVIDPENANTMAAISAAIPVAGKLAGSAGKGVAAVENKLFNKPTAQEQAANLEKVKEFQKAGYVIPPQDTRAGVGSQLLNALSGQAKTQQKASVLNNSPTTKGIIEDLGLPKDQPVTREAIADVRKMAGKAYEKAKSYGTIKTDDVFIKDIKDISDKYTSAANDFPELVGDDVNKLIKSLQKDQFDSSSAIDAIGILREKADKAYRAGDTTLGRAHKDAAKALEDMVGRHLKESGASVAVLSDYQNARKTIAKTYTADKAFNEGTGAFSKTKLARELKNGKPLEGNMLTAAEFGEKFPKASQELTATNPYSIMDVGFGGLGLASNPKLAALVASRPVARSLILSKPYQKAFVGNQVTVDQLMQSPMLQSLVKANPALISASRR